jgi:hypothetical protein
MKLGQVALSALVGVPIASLYALLVRLTFATGDFSLFLATMTCSFLFLVPPAIGALTVYLAPQEYRKSTPYALLMPWVSITIVCIGSIAFSLEAMICILMALPIFLVLSSIGGYLFLYGNRDKDNRPTQQNTMLGIILLAPYLFSPFEMRLPINTSYKIVENKIAIDAPANTVWENIITIPQIGPNEQGFSIFHAFGVPKLLETSALTRAGIGGLRTTIFDNGLAFSETVTYWDKNNRINFSISPSDQNTAPAPFSMIGKKHFAVTEMTYWIEPVDQDTIILHITSQHQLTTHFNSYASIWTDFMLSSLQNYVLQMIKARAENPST